jgi:hypothetical protein
MSAPRTQAANLLIRQFQSEAAAWDDAANDPDADRLDIRRQRAQARRDAIDWGLAQLRSALPAIEDEAVAEELGTAEWLSLGAGIPAAEWLDQ